MELKERMKESSGKFEMKMLKNEITTLKKRLKKDRNRQKERT